MNHRFRNAAKQVSLSPVGPPATSLAPIEVVTSPALPREPRRRTERVVFESPQAGKPSTLEGLVFSAGRFLGKAIEGTLLFIFGLLGKLGLLLLQAIIAVALVPFLFVFFLLMGTGAFQNRFGKA
jgi:hypothetical protein